MAMEAALFTTDQTPEPAPSTIAYKGDLVRFEGKEAVALWKQLRSLISDAAIEISERELLDGVIEGRRQLWVGKSKEGEAVFFTSINGSVLSIDTMAGEGLEDIRRWVEEICEWGRQQECEKAVFIGRHGWRRIFSDWRAYTTMLKDL